MKTADRIALLEEQVQELLKDLAERRNHAATTRALAVEYMRRRKEQEQV